MKVKVIDIDNKYRERKRRGKVFPNLALMKLSAFYKSRGDEVGFGVGSADMVFISCVFTKNEKYIENVKRDIDSNWSIGGSGVSFENKLAPEIEFIKPDYDLYPSEYSMGFTTRGCIRNCEFCIVRKKEGVLKRHQHIKEFHDFRFKSCKLLDNNILADPDWFFENTNWAIDNNVQLDITQGMDIRLMTPEIAKQLKRIKFVDQQVRFAWDNLIEERRVMDGISMLKDAGINTRRNVSFYVLSGFNTTFEEDLYRCDRLRDNRCNSFVMKYHEEDPMLNKLARWANRRQLYWLMRFEDYDGGRR
jgi:hypothetical protein